VKITRDLDQTSMRMLFDRVPVGCSNPPDLRLHADSLLQTVYKDIVADR